MKNFRDYNPIPVFAWFAAVICITAFCFNPFLSVISLSGVLSLELVLNEKMSRSFHVFISATALLCCLMNPIFSHNGRTPLVFINNMPVTLEAIAYGAQMGLTVAGIIHWGALFSRLMTSDKVIYLTGSLSPKAAVILTMSLRFVPLYIEKSRETRDVQKVMGLYNEGNFMCKLRGISRILDLMLTYSIEKTIITADSMAARGYSGGKRSRYKIFSFTPSDVIFSVTVVIFTALVAVSRIYGGPGFEFYPSIVCGSLSAVSIAGYVFFALMCFTPTLMQGGAFLKWHFLKSGISPLPTVAREKS